MQVQQGCTPLLVFGVLEVVSFVLVDAWLAARRHRRRVLVYFLLNTLLLHLLNLVLEHYVTGQCFVL